MLAGLVPVSADAGCAGMDLDALYSNNLLSGMVDALGKD